MSDNTELLTVFEEFKTKNDQRLKELEDGRDDVVRREEIERMNEAMSAIEEKQSEMVKHEAIESKLESLERAVYETQMGKPEDTAAQEEKNIFLDYARDAVTGHQNHHLTVKQQELDKKAVTIGTASAGGHAVPAPIAMEVLQLVLDISPIVQSVRRTSVNSPLYERLVDSRGTASGWAAEGDTRSDKATPTLNQVTFTHGELYALPKVSNWALNDMMFNVEAWLTSSVADEFAYQLGLAITSGDGTAKPTGILAGTPTSPGDEDSPARAFGTVQYIPTGVAASFPLDRLGSPAGNPGDILFNTIAEMKPRYLNNAEWFMNRNTANTVRKWKNGDGDYMWQPSLIGGQPSMLAGYPVINNEHLADEGANAFPVIFGDLGEAYEMIDIQGMRLIRDEVTAKGHTILYIAQRFGGKVVVDDAVKAIKCATS